MRRTDLRNFFPPPDPPTPEWLHALLEAAAYTPARAARALSVHHATVYRWLSPDPKKTRKMPWYSAVALVGQLCGADQYAPVWYDSPNGLRDRLAEAACSQQAAARLLRVDATTVRRWIAPRESRSWRKMPLAAVLALVELLPRVGHASCARTSPPMPEPR